MFNSYYQFMIVNPILLIKKLPLKKIAAWCVFLSPLILYIWFGFYSYEYIHELFSVLYLVPGIVIGSIVFLFGLREIFNWAWDVLTQD